MNEIHLLYFIFNFCASSVTESIIDWLYCDEVIRDSFKIWLILIARVFGPRFSSTRVAMVVCNVQCFWLSTNRAGRSHECHD